MSSTAQWKATVDPKSGRTYYFNKETKETTWTKPADYVDPAAAAAAPAAAAVAASADDPNLVGANWKSVVDPSSKRTYYYNKVTKKTDWKRPECMGPEPKAEGSAVGTPAGAQQATAAATPAPAPAPAPAAAAVVAKPEPTEAEILAAWNSTVDKSTGKTYWYNKITKKTTWENPIVEEKPTPAVSAVNKLKSLADDDDDDEKQVTTGDSLENARLMAQKQAVQANQQKELEETEEQDEERKGLKEDSDEEGGDYRMAKHRKGFFNRLFRIGDVVEDDKLMAFKKSLIKKALLKQNRELDAEAVQSFKNIMSFMGDRASSKGPIDHVKKILRNLMLAPASLRDEAYMQVCKQTTQNPRVDSCLKGWQLMSLFLASFPPSKNFKTFLSDYLKKNLEPEYKECKSTVGMCIAQLENIVLMGQRSQIMSKTEIECVMTRRKVPVTVQLVNETIFNFEVDSYTTCAGLMDLICSTVELRFQGPFALFEAGVSNVERLLDPKERILDVVGSWENEPVEAEVDEDKKHVEWVSPYNHFVFKAKLVLKTTTQEVVEDPECVNLLYLQAVHDVTTNRYPLKEKDIPVLAALQLQAEFSDFKPSMHIAGWLAPRIQKYMPIVLCQGKKGIDQKLVKEWEQKILSKYPKVSGFKVQEAKLHYLEFMQEWTFYGATFFIVEQRQFKDYPSPLSLGITAEGILLMHPEKRIVLETYPLPDVLTWGHSDEKFVVVVGNLVSQRKLIFKTSAGKQMNLLVREYVKYKVKAKASERPGAGGAMASASSVPEEKGGDDGAF